MTIKRKQECRSRQFVERGLLKNMTKYSLIQGMGWNMHGARILFPPATLGLCKTSQAVIVRFA